MSTPKVKVVIFSGGRGASAIINAFHARPDIELTVLVNGYDDGKSTGVIRSLFPDLLGPSDFRKVIANILNAGDKSDKTLSVLLEFRLTEEFLSGARSIILDLNGNICPSINNINGLLGQFIGDIRHNTGEYVTSIFTIGLTAFTKHPDFRLSLLDDMSLGNLIFLGAWIEADKNFNITINTLTERFQIQTNILNINDGSSLYLVGIKLNNEILWNESEIVSKQVTSPIKDLFLFEINELRRVNRTNSAGINELSRQLNQFSIIPTVNPLAIQKISKADIIVYGPGTQNSSLFPSYLTQGISSAIFANINSSKFFVANIDEDLDIAGENLESLMAQFAFFMNKYSIEQFKVFELIDFALVNSSDGISDSWILSGFKKSNFSPAIALGSWADSQRKHSGERVARSILSLALQRGGPQPEFDFDSVSVVVPVLNEVATIRQVIEELSTFDWLEHKILLEIVVVDGGSTDGSLQYLRELPQLKLMELPIGTGRGSALTTGVKSTNGQYVITYPADSEYSLNGLLACINMLRETSSQIVFGSRVPFCQDSDARLKEIYEGKRREYLQSKWGGLLISFLLALLHKRWISDPLTSIKGFRKDVLLKLSLSQSGIDWDTQIVMDARISGITIVEVPVDYAPRNRSQGKKTRPIDGLPLVLKLIRGRFGKTRSHLS